MILALHGFLPGLSPVVLMALLGPGMIECLHRQDLTALVSWCTDVGLPLGTPYLNGLPEVYLGWLLSYLRSVDAWDAHRLSGALIDAVGLLAGYRVMRRWKVPPWIALYTSTLYLTSLSVLQLNGFLYTFSGFILLPLYLLVALKILDTMSTKPWLAISAMPFLASLMLFTDGYSYFAASLLIGFLGIRWTAGDLRAKGHRLLAASTWLVSNLMAVFAYLIYVPGPPQPLRVGIGAFRYLGLDVATLVIPSKRLWWASAARIEVPLPLWGDGSNIYSNYIGFTTLGLVIWFLWQGSTTLDLQSRGETRYLLVAGTLALFLALGPALKVYEVATPIEPTWDVPVEATTLVLPTAWLYEHVPGFDQLRATYRWFVATRLTYYFTAGLALSGLWCSRTRRRRVGAIAIACLLAIETAPNMPAEVVGRRNAAAHVDAIRTRIIPDIARLIRPDETILILPSNNDFLAAAVFPFVDASTFNTGVDKNYWLARDRWPENVESAVAGFGSPDQLMLMCRVLQSDADAILLPHLSYYAGALHWPPDPEVVSAMRITAATIGTDPRFQPEIGEWATVIRSATDTCDER